jgi:hypothetical protein
MRAWGEIGDCGEAMESDLALRVIRTAFRCGEELGSLLRLLKERCGAEEYAHYARAIAAAVDKINVELIERVLASHPELAQKIERDIENHGRVITPFDS